MEITFHCNHCKQQLAADAHAAGQAIQCPTCNASITIPQPDASNVHLLNPMATSAAAKIERHFAVPVHDGPAELLIKQAKPKEEDEPVEGPKKLRMKVIRHTDCVEVGRDRYEETVATFLNKIGEENIINLAPLTYTHIDIGTQKILTDFAIQIIYRH